MTAHEIPSALAVEEAQRKIHAIAQSQKEPTSAPFHPTQEVAEYCTDVGNAARFVLQNRGAKYCAPWDNWLLWDGTRWKPDDSLKIVRLGKDTALSIFDEAKRSAERDEKSDKLSRWAARSQERSRLDAMIALARPDLAVTPEALDRDAFLLNVENCTIDLRSGEARPHSREDLITKLAPVVYDPDAKAPRWERFLGEIFAENQALIEYLRRFVGYCLTGDVAEQYFHVFYGAGANGKSSLVDTLVALFGDYATIAPADLLTARHGDDGHPTELTTLCGKRFAVASETEEGRRLRPARVKALTGDEKLTARYMRADNFTFQQTHKIVLITNHRPRISDDTDSLWRRTRLIPFSVHFAEAVQDKSLLQKLRGEFSGILNWAVEGCLSWQREGLRAPDEVAAATAEYREAEDVLADFLAERCGFDGLAYVERGGLFAAYEGWAEGRKEKYPLNRRSFYENIRRREGVSETQRKISGRPERLFLGIGLSNV